MSTNRTVGNVLPHGVAGLISINKPYTDEIFIGFKKRIEWRKTALPLGKYYVYETKNKGGCGKVIGEVRVCEHTRYCLKSKLDLKFIPPVVIMLGCVEEEHLFEYANGKPIYANLLTGIIKYNRPRALNEFQRLCPFDGDCDAICLHAMTNGNWEIIGCTNRVTNPPQSWCKVQELKI